MQPCPGERSAPHSLVLTVRTSHDKSLSFKGPQHAAEIAGVNSQATTKLANFDTFVSNLPKQSSLVYWPTTLEKPVADGTDALRNGSVEAADFLNRGFLYFSDHSQRLSPKLQMHMNCTALFRWFSRQCGRDSLHPRLRGGGRGIRTPGTLSGTAVFKTACFNHSHIPPRGHWR
jgi:hypothetical protein